MYHEYATTAARVMTSPKSSAGVGDRPCADFDGTAARIQQRGCYFPIRPGDAVGEQTPELGVLEVVGVPERRVKHPRAFGPVNVCPRDRLGWLPRDRPHQQRCGALLQGADFVERARPNKAGD